MSLWTWLEDFIDGGDWKCSRYSIAGAIARERIERDRPPCEVGAQKILARMRAREEAGKFLRRKA